MEKGWILDVQSSAIHLKYSDHLKFLVLKCINGHAALRHYTFQGLLFCFVLSCMYFFNLEMGKSFKMYEILFLKQRCEQQNIRVENALDPNMCRESSGVMPRMLFQGSARVSSQQRASEDHLGFSRL